MKRATKIGFFVIAGLLVFLLLSGNRGRRVDPFPAPPLSADPARWLHAEPMSPGDGHVYLIDVWSYG